MLARSPLLRGARPRACARSRSPSSRPSPCSLLPAARARRRARPVHRGSSSKGPLFGALGAFVGGLLTAATPCIYPMIAITVSIFGAREAKSRAAGHAALDELRRSGIVTLFTPMLVVAALTGTLFGSAAREQVGRSSASSAFFVRDGRLDVRRVRPHAARLAHAAALRRRRRRLRRRVRPRPGQRHRGRALHRPGARPASSPGSPDAERWSSAAIVGLCFSLGLGLPFFLVGAFAVGLPKGGKWMLGIKSFFGVVMLSSRSTTSRTPSRCSRGLARPDNSVPRDLRRRRGARPRPRRRAPVLG